MDRLTAYVEQLFSKQPKTKEMQDLKEEILSNLLLKQQDLIEQGKTEQEAFLLAKQDLTSVESLLPDVQEIYINRYKTECIQNVFIASILFSILTIPLLLVQLWPVSVLALFIMLICCVFFLLAKSQDQQETALRSSKECKKICNRTWLIWGVFFAVCVLATTAVLFASNLWFWRPIVWMGPYQFAKRFVYYYLPLSTIVFPIAVNSFPKIYQRHGKGEHDAA